MRRLDEDDKEVDFKEKFTQAIKDPTKEEEVLMREENEIKKKYISNYHSTTIEFDLVGGYKGVGLGSCALLMTNDRGLLLHL